MKTFFVWCPEQGSERDDACEIEAHDAESAAEKWAEEDDADSAEYMIFRGSEKPTVCVAEGDGPEQRFIVRGESLPCYYATAVQAGEQS